MVQVDMNGLTGMPINMGRILVVDPESFLKNPMEEHRYHALP